jgi:hypothetical protein
MAAAPVQVQVFLKNWEKDYPLFSDDLPGEVDKICKAEPDPPPKEKLHFIQCADKENWLYARSIFVITASEVASLLGLNPNCTRVEIYRTKLLKEDPAKIYRDNKVLQEILDWGTEHEGVACDEAFKVIKTMKASKEGWRFAPEDLVLSICEHMHAICGIYSHPANKHALKVGATPDRIFSAFSSAGKAIQGPACLLEVKCPAVKPLTGEVPYHHMIQMQVQMECTDTNYCVYYCWTPNESRMWLVKRSREVWEHVIEPAIETFVDHYVKHVQWVPPRPDSKYVLPISNKVGPKEKQKNKEYVERFCPETRQGSGYWRIKKTGFEGHWQLYRNQDSVLLGPLFVFPN